MDYKRVLRKALLLAAGGLGGWCSVASAAGRTRPVVVLRRSETSIQEPRFQYTPSRRRLYFISEGPRSRLSLFPVSPAGALESPVRVLACRVQLGPESRDIAVALTETGADAEAGLRPACLAPLLFASRGCDGSAGARRPTRWLSRPNVWSAADGCGDHRLREPSRRRGRAGVGAVRIAAGLLPRQRRMQLLSCCGGLPTPPGCRSVDHAEERSDRELPPGLQP